MTVVGDNDSPEMVPCTAPLGFSVNVADAELAEVAVMVADVAEPTAVVETVKVPELDPCGIVIEAGTVAEAELLERLTSTPPAGAAADKVTVPVED